MVGAAAAPGPAVRLVQKARQAAALDTLLAAQATGLFDQLIVATNDSMWASELPLEAVVDLDDAHQSFHFGRRLAHVIDTYGLTHVLYMGAGAAPLIETADLAAIAQEILAAENLIVTNNLHSSDWAAFTPAAILAAYTHRVERDNALAWVLYREAGLPVRSRPPTAASRLDIDTPADLLVLSLHPRCGPQLAAQLGEQALDTGQLQRALAVLSAEGKHVIVSGRVASSTWAAMERGTLCWVRLFAEERGMVASGRQAAGEARSLLGAYLDQVGMDRFFQTLCEWSDAVFMDNRVIMAHRGLWPASEERFASDLGWVDRVDDPFLQEFTAAAQGASIPIILGGHSLVSGGLLAIVDMIGGHQQAAICN